MTDEELVSAVKAVVGKRLRSLPAGVDRRDLESAGYEAAVKARASYSPSYGVPIGAHISQRVAWALADEIRFLRGVTRNHPDVKLHSIDYTPTLVETLPSPQVEISPDSVMVREILAKLTPRQKQIAYAYVYLDMAQKDIATMVGTTPQTVNQTTSLIRKLIRQELSECPG